MSGYGRDEDRERLRGPEFGERRYPSEERGPRGDQGRAGAYRGEQRGPGYYVDERQRGYDAREEEYGARGGQDRSPRGYGGGENWGGAGETTGRNYEAGMDRGGYRDDRFGGERSGGGYGPGTSYGGYGRGESHASHGAYGERGDAGRSARGGFGHEQYYGEHQGRADVREEQSRGNWGNYQGEQSGLYRGPYGSGRFSHGEHPGAAHGEHRGRGPRGYTRSDERIREDVNDRLADDPHLDAREIEASVQGGEVTLNGYVQSRNDKRRAEDLAHEISGVGHVQNNLRVRGLLANLFSGGGDTASGGSAADTAAPAPRQGPAASGTTMATSGTAGRGT